MWGSSASKLDALRPLPGALFALAGTLLSVRALVSPGNAALFYAVLAAGCALVLGACALSRALRPGRGLSWLAGIAGALLLFFVGTPGACVRGSVGLLNACITLWNAAYEEGAALFPVDASVRDVQVFLLVLLFLLTAAVWQLALRGRVAGMWLYAGGWTLLLLLLHRFSALGCVLLYLGAICVWLYQPGGRPSHLRFVWLCIAAAFLLVGQGLFSGRSAVGIDALRATSAQMLHELRYGHDALPEGDLRAAAGMQSGDGVMLTVTSQQAKTLYLCSYTGGRYRDGVWEPLPGSAYGGDYAGMLNWLSARDFLPATQYSSFLSAGEDASYAENTVEITAVGADRSRLYLPYSTDLSQLRQANLRRDSQTVSARLLGSRSYTFTEHSGLFPCELMQQSAWLSEAETEDQTAYLQSEAVYRAFVYDQYLEVDEALSARIDDFFWREAEEMPQGIYAATLQIRTALLTGASYDESCAGAPENADPIAWFLQTGAGNSALFSAAAVEAYRSCGIPARYAEGYLLPQSRVQPGEAVDLTGADAHAWVEVYLDGVGWLPVDVTPGYYLDSYTLQALVRAPESIQTALALNDSDKTADEQPGDSAPAADADDAPHPVRAFLSQALHVLLAILMCVAGALVVLAVLVPLAKLRLARRFRRLSPEGRGLWLCTFIERALALLGIRIATDIPQADAVRRLCRLFPALAPETCRRASFLMEKVLFSASPLLPHEERTLCWFVRVLWSGRRALPWRKRLYLTHLPFLIPMREPARSGAEAPAGL